MRKCSSREIDGFLKMISGHNQRLSMQADVKAHILIRVNAIVLSVVIAFLLVEADKNHRSLIPVLFLMTTNAAVITLSVWSTLPKAGVFPPGQTDMLFFDDFNKLKLEDYSTSLLQLMDNEPMVHDHLIRDIFHQAIIVSRKFRLLRTSYNVFMWGLSVSVLAFVVAALFNR